MQDLRMIGMKWTQRNITRIVKRFDIVCDFSGSFTSRIGNGYKMVYKTGKNGITFVFLTK